jgi:phosphoglycerol transferase
MPFPSRRALLRFCAYQAAFSGVGLAGWIGRSFGPTSLEQILWHLRYSEGAAVRMGSLFLFEFVFEVLLFPAAFALMAAILHAAAAGRWQGRKRVALRAAPPLALALAAGMLLAQFSVFSYAAAQFGPDRFAQAFVEPKGVPLQVGAHRRNLVLVYAESLEETYGDARLFGRDLLAATRTLGGRSYACYRPMPGATWTMAAMVATQCGVPLKVYSEADVRHRPGHKSFLAGATCLGDLLQAQGWRNVFLGGAPLSFAGKGAFLRDHGYAEAWGRDEWERAGLRAEELNEWGLHDSALYERALARLAQLHAAGQPFNLTLLTMDTHNPHGFMSPACRRRGAHDFTGIVRCAGEQLADFVREARRRGYLQDTVVVVIGDHLAMPNPAWDQLQPAGSRRTMFNLFLGQGLPAANTDELLPFDLFPTLLELAGFDVRGDRLGLGYSAVGPAPAGRPQDRAQRWSPAALRGSAVYDRLWAADGAAWD